MIPPARSDLYTEADVRAATEALMPFFGDDVIASPREHSTRFARAVLDAVAPAIAARALRQIADDMPRNSWWVNRRADEIEKRAEVTP